MLLQECIEDNLLICYCRSEFEDNLLICYCRSVLRIIYWTTSTLTMDWRWQPRYFSSSRWPLSSLSLCIYSGTVLVIFNFYPYFVNLLSRILSFHRWENFISPRWRASGIVFFIDTVFMPVVFPDLFNLDLIPGFLINPENDPGAKWFSRVSFLCPIYHTVSVQSIIQFIRFPKKHYS